MKTDTPEYEIISTARPKHSIAMSVDMESLPELFDVLSGLYTDSEMAIIRELATNARDSHIEAGVTRPIEITLPTTMEPNLVIQDFGLGMSCEDIVDTYSKYGASTKRHSDDYNGTLGLGSKSPLTYTPQFTFVGIKNGVKTTVSVAKSDRAPVMKIMSEVPTDEGNGVKVIVPARSGNSFTERGEHIFRFWDPGTVLINGEAPRRIEGMRVTDRIMVTKETEGQSYIVMGGVPYPVRFDHSLLKGYAIVAFVEIGAVSFTPSRESLKTPSQKNRERIAAILAEYEREVPTAVQEQIEQAANAREAFQKLSEWRSALGARTLAKTEYKYKGRTIPVEFAPKNERFTVSARNSSKLSAHSRDKSIPIETVVNALCIYGYDLNFTPSHKKKLNKYVEDNGIENVVHYVLAPTKLPTHWLDPKRVVNWETIREIRLPRTWTSNVDPDRIKGSYDICEQGDWIDGVPAEDIDTTSPIYYVDVTHHDNADVAGDLLKRHKRNFTIVKLTSNRVTKFKRLFPKAELVDKELTRIRKRIERKVTDDERRAHMVQNDYNLKNVLYKVDVTRIDDPAFAELDALLKLDLSKCALNKLRQFPNNGVKSRGEHQVADPFDKYPLVDESNFRYTSQDNVDEAYFYLNASYAARVAREAAKVTTSEEDK